MLNCAFPDIQNNCHAEPADLRTDDDYIVMLNLFQHLTGLAVGFKLVARSYAPWKALFIVGKILKRVQDDTWGVQDDTGNIQKGSEGQSKRINS